MRAKVINLVNIAGIAQRFVRLPSKQDIGVRFPLPAQMEKFQKQVDDWVSQYKIGYFKPLEILARLTEEVGELARELNHLFGPKKKKVNEKNNNVGDEIADTIFTLTCLANSLDIDVDKHLKRIIDKCYGRVRNRWKKK